MNEVISDIIESPLAFLLALLLLAILELPVSWILRGLGQNDEILPPRGANQEIWNQISSVQRPRGGVLIGRIERFLLFVLVLAAPEVIVAWLAFKVASKWEVWTNLYKVPDNIEGIDQLDFLRARMDLGSRTYQRFLVGTSANIIAALVSVGIFHLLEQSIPCL